MNKTIPKLEYLGLTIIVLGFVLYVIGFDFIAISAMMLGAGTIIYSDYLDSKKDL